MAVTKRIRKTNGKKKTVYLAEIYINGNRVLSKSFESKSLAYLWHDREKERYLARSGKPGTFVEEMTFEDCLNQYAEKVFPRLKKQSRQSREVRWLYFQEAPFKKVKMRNLSAESIDQWLEWLIKHPTAQNPGRKSFLHELKLLTAVLNWYRNEVDASFVVPVVRRHRLRAQYKAVAVRRPDYFARPEQIQKWVQWLKNHRPSVYWRLATFMILTGVRVGEAAGLLWDAVDLENAEALIARNVVWDHRTRDPSLEDSTKTEESTRVIVLAPELVQMLRKLKEESGGTGPVFYRKEGEYLRYNMIQSAFNAGFEALNLPWRSTHICRHTYATMALKATQNLGAVQVSLGHRSQKVTEKYAKVVALLNRNTAEKTAQIFALSGS